MNEPSAPPAAGTPPGEARVCSSRGCRRAASVELRWNNPRLHPPQRRKSWLACPDHEASLAEFLDVRGFLRETVPLRGETPA